MILLSDFSKLQNDLHSSTKTRQHKESPPAGNQKECSLKALPPQLNPKTESIFYNIS